MCLRMNRERERVRERERDRARERQRDREIEREHKNCITTSYFFAISCDLVYCPCPYLVKHLPNVLKKKTKVLDTFHRTKNVFQILL